MFTHLTAVWKFRHFWMSLVQMDLRTRYRRSVLGVGWSVLNPVLMSAVIVLGIGRILSKNPNLYDFGMFVLPGLCAWDFLRNSTVAGCDALVANESYIRQCPLPYGIYPLRTVLGVGVHFGITLGVTALINVALSGPAGRDPAAVAQAAWCLPAVFAVILTFAWGSATLAAFASAYFPDIKYLIEVTATMLFFLTPVMFPPAAMPDAMKVVADYNPAFYFLELVRSPLYEGVVPAADLWATCAGIAAASFAAGALTIRLLAGKVIFQL